MGPLSSLYLRLRVAALEFEKREEKVIFRWTYACLHYDKCTWAGRAREGREQQTTPWSSCVLHPATIGVQMWSTEASKRTSEGGRVGTGRKSSTLPATKRPSSRRAAPPRRRRARAREVGLRFDREKEGHSPAAAARLGVESRRERPGVMHGRLVICQKRWRRGRPVS
eukprot:scaffold11547_cov108-Isochrysis_galbana.AAC.5